jgi:hypothetical protein
MNDSAPRETPKPLLVLIAGPDLDVARARELGLPVCADASELLQRAASADGAAR